MNSAGEKIKPATRKAAGNKIRSASAARQTGNKICGQPGGPKQATRSGTFATLAIQQAARPVFSMVDEANGCSMSKTGKKICQKTRT
jgi:hypothetical protein